MKWKKLGLIFCPTNYYDWMVSHASVPFAELLFNDIYRIYFSTRDKQQRSYVGYLDISISNPKTIINLSSTPLVSPGGIGTFDEDGAMLSWIVSSQHEKYLYYIGWNTGKTVPFKNAIGLAISSGNEFIKYSTGPIMDRSIYDPCFTASSCILHENEIWRMWYLSGIRWQKDFNKFNHWYDIKYAESVDGIHWDRRGITCITFNNPSEYAISRPCVIKERDIYRMWYSYRGTAYRIGYAESYDGITWERLDEKAGIDVSSNGWDANMIEYPFVFEHQGTKYMLYNGDGYGKTGFGLAILESGFN